MSHTTNIPDTFRQLETLVENKLYDEAFDFYMDIEVENYPQRYALEEMITSWIPSRFVENNRLVKHKLLLTFINVVKRNMTYTFFRNLDPLISHPEDIATLQQPLSLSYGTLTAVKKESDENLLTLLKLDTPDRVKEILLSDELRENLFFHKKGHLFPQIYREYKHLLPEPQMYLTRNLTACMDNWTGKSHKFDSEYQAKIVLFILDELDSFEIRDPQTELPDWLITQSVRNHHFNLAEIFYDRQAGIEPDTYQFLTKVIKRSSVESLKLIDLSHPVWSAISGNNYKRLKTLINKEISKARNSLSPRR